MSEAVPDDLAESRDVTYHGKNHGKDGRDKVIHPLLGGLHKGTDSAHAPVLGDIIVAQGSPADWERYGFTPAGSATTRNALVGDNGDTVPTYKATLDATAPTTIAEGDAAAAGTSLIYPHRDHKHGAPATWKSTAHNLLDGDRHGDTVAQGASRGSLVYGNSTPKWDELVRGNAGDILGCDGTDIGWGPVFTYAGYTPTVTQGGTVTSFTTNNARFTVLGKHVHVEGNLIINNAGGAAAANIITISLPITASASIGNPAAGSGGLYDLSLDTLYPWNGLINTTTTFVMVPSDQLMVGYAASGLFLGALRFVAALANGDSINFNFTYEVA